MLLCVLIAVLISIAMGVYGYFHIMAQLGFLRHGNEDNFRSFEQTRIDVMAGNESVLKQLHGLHEHVTVKVDHLVHLITDKLDVIAILIRNIPSMEERIEVVSALIRRLPDKDFFQGKCDAIINNQTSFAKSIKDILDIANFVQPLAARNKIIDENIKAIVPKITELTKIFSTFEDMENDIPNLLESVRSSNKALAQVEAKMKAADAVAKERHAQLLSVSDPHPMLADVLKKLSQKPDALNDLALTVSQIKKELSNTSTALSTAIEGLKLEIAKPSQFVMTEQIERKMIDTFIKVNKIMQQQEDPKKVEKKPSKEKPTKLTLEVITRIKTLRKRGMSYAKIGKALSLSQATVYKVINP